jgi:hypothetical protein
MNPLVETRESSVAELQGLYGPFTFPEKLLQKIWLQGEFARGPARTTSGATVFVIHPGRWNLLGGPDFRDARLRLGSEEVCGDVELHLHAEDWAAHRHASDRAYDRVRLHVVLFPPSPGHLTIGADGKSIPVLPLLPLLLHDLEEYAAQDAVETMASRPVSQILEKLAPLPTDELLKLLANQASARWRQKVHFARVRVQRLGWEEACHQTALEILGYRFNRAPMLRLAGMYPLKAWSDSSQIADELFEQERDGWSLQGLRPANHPRRRLQQYLAWVKAAPDWPLKLREFISQLPRVEAVAPTSQVRRDHRFGKLRAELLQAICAGTVGGTRFDNLVCDGFLPLMGAQQELSIRDIWYHWFTGDLPPVVVRALKQLCVFDGRERPACHGAAQGLIGWLLEQERDAAPTAGRGA